MSEDILKDFDSLLSENNRQAIKQHKALKEQLRKLGAEDDPKPTYRIERYPKKMESVSVCYPQYLPFFKSR